MQRTKRQLNEKGTIHVTYKSALLVWLLACAGALAMLRVIVQAITGW